MSKQSFRVIDESNKPIIGAVVLVDGRKNDITTIPIYTNNHGEVELDLSDEMYHEIQVHIDGEHSGGSVILWWPQRMPLTLRLWTND